MDDLGKLIDESFDLQLARGKSMFLCGPCSILLAKSPDNSLQMDRMCYSCHKALNQAHQNQLTDAKHEQ